MYLDTLELRKTLVLLVAVLSKAPCPLELNRGYLILCLPRPKDDRRLTSKSSSSRVRHRDGCKAKGVWARNTQHVTDAYYYTDNCVVSNKISVVTVVAFVIAGRKTAIFQQRNGLFARTKKLFFPTYTPFSRVRSHI